MLAPSNDAKFLAEFRVKFEVKFEAGFFRSAENFGTPFQTAHCRKSVLKKFLRAGAKKFASAIPRPIAIIPRPL